MFSCLGFVGVILIQLGILFILCLLVGIDIFKQKNKLLCNNAYLCKLKKFFKIRCLYQEKRMKYVFRGENFGSYSFSLYWLKLFKRFLFVYFRYFWIIFMIFVIIGYY